MSTTYPQEFWNQRYAEETYAYGTQPNTYFKQQLDAISNPGKLLLLAEGEGRNAVYAAQQGWEVTAVDFSQVGREKALALAAQRGVTLNYHHADIQVFEFDEHGPWDLVGLIYAHFPSEARASIHAKCIQALHPGGRLILEAFNPQQINRLSGGPKNVELLYGKALLAKDFAAMEILELVEDTVLLEEGEGHLGLGEVVRGLFKKSR